MSSLRLTLLAAVTAALLLIPSAAQASISAGLSKDDGEQIYSLAKTRWPKLPCATVMTLKVPARLMHGLKVATDRKHPCTILFNRSVQLSATGWCRALEGVFARLAKGTRRTAWPWDCSMVVGPLPKTPRVLQAPGVGPSTMQRVYEVAGGHWPKSSCHGREQLRWAHASQLAAGSEGHSDDIVTMGVARLSDPRCIVYLNADFGQWDPALLCAVIEHEFGHLSGLGHDPEIDPVMAPVNAVAADCVAAFGPPAADFPVDVAQPAGFGGLGG